MHWRRLRAGELDHEALWLGVSAAALALAGLWFWLRLPVPDCTFRNLTGVACPTCGMTRCLRSTLHLDCFRAVRINPLAFVSYGAVAVFDLYAAVVLALRLPRLRCDDLPAPFRQGVRCTAIAAILGNWAWLWWIGL